MRFMRHIFIMCNHYDGSAIFLVKLQQNIHDLVAHGTIQVAGWLIG